MTGPLGRGGWIEPEERAAADQVRERRLNDVGPVADRLTKDHGADERAAGRQALEDALRALNPPTVPQRRIHPGKPGDVWMKWPDGRIGWGKVDDALKAARERDFTANLVEALRRTEINGVVEHVPGTTVPSAKESRPMDPIEPGRENDAARDKTDDARWLERKASAERIRAAYLDEWAAISTAQAWAQINLPPQDRIEIRDCWFAGGRAPFRPNYGASNHASPRAIDVDSGHLASGPLESQVRDASAILGTMLGCVGRVHRERVDSGASHTGCVFIGTDGGGRTEKGDVVQVNLGPTSQWNTGGSMEVADRPWWQTPAGREALAVIHTDGPLRWMSPREAVIAASKGATIGLVVRSQRRAGEALESLCMAAEAEGFTAERWHLTWVMRFRFNNAGAIRVFTDVESTRGYSIHGVTTG
jgi:hypothetical protein